MPEEEQSVLAAKSGRKDGSLGDSHFRGNDGVLPAKCDCPASIRDIAFVSNTCCAILSSSLKRLGGWRASGFERQKATKVDEEGNRWK